MQSRLLQLFSHVVTACQEQRLVEFDLLAVDSVNVRASANYKQSKNLAGVTKEEDKITERLQEILATAKNAESAEAEELQTLLRKKERVEIAKAKLLERLAEKSRAASEQERSARRETEKVVSFR